MWRMMMEDNITKLIMDIGNSHIKLLVGEVSTDFTRIKVLQYVEVPTKGMKKSMVESSDELSYSIQRALKSLENPEHRELEKVTIGIGGKYIQSKTRKLFIEFEEREVEESDVEKLYELAEECLETGELILKREMYNIKINSAGIVKNPIGLVANRLEANVHLVYVDREDIEKLTAAIIDAGLEIENIYLNAYASLKSTLIDEESTKMGVALVDIGEGATDIIISKNHKIIYAKSANLGGIHFMSDIMYLFRVSEEEAREVYSAYIKGEMKEKYISSSGKCFAKEDVEKIIDARIGDIATFILNTIQESGFTGYLGQGMVLTGGVASLDRLVGKINGQTGGIVRRKKPLSIRGLEDPEYKMATVIGLFLEAIEEEMELQQKRNEQEEVKVQNDDLEELLESHNHDVERKSSGEAMVKIKKWISYFI